MRYSLNILPLGEYLTKYAHMYALMLICRTSIRYGNDEYSLKHLTLPEYEASDSSVLTVMPNLHGASGWYELLKSSSRSECFTK